MRSPRPFLLLVLASLALLAAGCRSTAPAPPVPAEAPAAAAEVPRVAEAWRSAWTPEDNIDSLALWQGLDDGGEAATLLLATAKETDRLVVYDAATGETLRTAGRSGTGPGAFERPNGIAVLGDLALVVERDNHRVQGLLLPELTPLGTFGAEVLRRPYGLAVGEGEEHGVIDVYVTDNYEGPGETVPPDGELGERVAHFQVRVAEDPDAAEVLVPTVVRRFGDTEGPGVLRVVESIALDRPWGRLLVAEERESDTALKVYTPAGRFTGQVLARDGDRRLFESQAEGIALYPCAEGGGYWVTTDQGPTRTVFLLFERKTLKLAGRFTGELTANTDGITVTAEPVGPFPEGALFAVHDDQGATAFDWRDVRAALGLPSCAD